MNTAPLHHSIFFDVASSRRELRIRNDEVAGSIPASSTKVSIPNLPPQEECCIPYVSK